MVVVCHQGHTKKVSRGMFLKYLSLQLVLEHMQRRVLRNKLPHKLKSLAQILGTGIPNLPDSDEPIINQKTFQKYVRLECKKKAYLLSPVGIVFTAKRIHTAAYV